jgi:hypothetical protein
MSTSGAGAASSSRPHGSASISSSPDPRSKPIDLSPLKELVKDSLLETLIGIPGGKTLVLDKDLSGSLGLVVDVGSLKVGSSLLLRKGDLVLSSLYLFNFKCWSDITRAEPSGRKDVLVRAWTFASTDQEHRLPHSTQPPTFRDYSRSDQDSSEERCSSCFAYISCRISTSKDRISNEYHGRIGYWRRCGHQRIRAGG